MPYPFVQAKYDYGPSPTTPKAILIHMAEGGGTVHYLSKSGGVNNGNSSHFVIEGTGKITQMIQLNHTAGSIRVSSIRTDNDADGFFGATVAKAVLGLFWKNPNVACIAIEIEGFAKDGPNAVQQDSLRELYLYLHSQLPSLIGSLGHRDLQNYKPCPGKKIPWGAVNKHGVWSTSVVQAPITVSQHLVSSTSKTNLYDLDGKTLLLTYPAGFTERISPFQAAGMYAIYSRADGKAVRLYLCHPDIVKAVPTPTPSDCTDAINAAVSADRAKAHIVYS